ncbi:MAG TPA: hypothetical protein VOA87_12405 [Thermoanaerobaculia bacterium]|nr:hypothetical protein [Thermoanaerobaculia bacterium]
MPSEYDPFFADRSTVEDDLEPVRARFAAASRPYLHSPWSWLAWAVLLPAAALATPLALHRNGPAGVLLAWSVTILLGGAVEVGAILRAGGRSVRTPLAVWVLRVQGNLSFVALALSALLLWQDAAWALPALWLLLLGHSFYMLGGLAFPPFRTCGRIYQVGGLAALWPFWNPLLVFAAATAAGNLWMAYRIWRQRRLDPYALPSLTQFLPSRLAR